MTEFAKLQWRCRRGMRELDGLLLRYLTQRYSLASTIEQQRFQTLLTLPDIELYRYFIGQKQPNNTEILAMINVILQL